MALAGFNSVVAVATGASTTYSTMDGIINVSLDDGRDTYDITDLADSNIRRRIAGLRDLSFSLDGDLELASTAYAIVKATYSAGNPVFVQFLADGTNGIMSPCLVEKIGRGSSVDGKVTVSLSLQGEGSIDPVTIASGI